MATSDVKVSKALSWLLRHGASQEGLTLGPGGWARLDETLQKLKIKTDVERVKVIVSNDEKQRFSLKEEEGQIYIRANQGHSVQIEDLELKEIAANTMEGDVIHGTYYRHWPSIKEKGLSRMSRNHIHFAPGLPGDSEVISGMRSSCQLYIYVDLQKALTGGYKFYRSTNNVILCPGNDKGFLPPDYFLKVVDKKTGKDL